MRRAGASDRHEAPWHVVSLTPTLQSKALNIGPNQRRLRDGLLLCLEGVAAAERTGHSAVVRIKADRASLGYDDVKVALEVSGGAPTATSVSKSSPTEAVLQLPSCVGDAASCSPRWGQSDYVLGSLAGVDIAQSASIGLYYGNRTTGQGAGRPLRSHRSSSGSTLVLASDLSPARPPGRTRAGLGYLKPGDQLPKVRDVVATPAINPNTVSKAHANWKPKV